MVYRTANAKVPGIDREIFEILYNVSQPTPLWARYWFIPGVLALVLPREKVTGC